MNMLRAKVFFERKDFCLETDVEFPAQKISVLYGPSGSGKTSLLRILAGLETPHQGEIIFNGVQWLNTDEKINLPPQKRHIGMVFQDYALFEHMSISKNIAFGIERSSGNVAADEWIARLHLDKHREKYPAQLSGGQRQRVALARALATEPCLLLLDEPLSAIDIQLRTLIREDLGKTIRALNTTVVLVTHDLEDALRLGDYLFVMHNGRIIQRGPLANVMACPESAESARVLGWKNVLPITQVSDEFAGSTWGQLSKNNEQVTSSHSFLIRPEHLTLNLENETGIHCKILNVIDRGIYTEVFGMCRDKSAVTMYLSTHDKIPCIDDEVILTCNKDNCRIVKTLAGAAG